MPFDFVILVGMTGFEPATSSSRTMRATKLCYIPTERYYTLALGKMQVNFMFFLCKANLLHKFRKKCIVEAIEPVKMQCSGTERLFRAALGVRAAWYRHDVGTQ